MFIVLLLSAGVAVAPIEIITRTATKKLSDQTDRIAQLRCRTIRKTVSAVLVGTEWLGDSFLSNMSHISYPDAEGDIVHAYHMMTDDQLKKLSTEGLYNTLKLFLESNYDLFSASFVFKPGVISDAPARGIAANVRCSDFKERDLLDDYDIFSKDIFLDGESKKVTYISNAKQVSEEKTSVISFVFPLFNENGVLVGEFWADVLLDKLSDIITKSIPSDDFTATVLDKNLRSVSSNISEWNARDYADIVKELAGEAYSRENIKEAEELIRKREKISFNTVFNGQEFRIMLSPLEGYDYTILVATPTDVLSSEIIAFKRYMLLVSLIGIVLLKLFSCRLVSCPVCCS